MGSVASIPTAVTLSNNANVTYNQNTPATLNNVVSGTGSFTKAGGAVLTIGAAQTYSGVATVTGGTLQLAASVTLPTALSSTMDGRRSTKQRQRKHGTAQNG